MLKQVKGEGVSVWMEGWVESDLRRRVMDRWTSFCVGGSVNLSVLLN